MTTPFRIATMVMFVVLATIAGVFAFQYAGYRPCDLCLAERKPYYVAVVLALATSWAANGRRTNATTFGFVVLTLVFVWSVLLGANHAGVEWGLWSGPADCTGTVDRATSTDDFLLQLRTVKSIRCDAPAVLVLGLSMAAWNAIVSLGLVGLTAWGAKKSVASARSARPGAVVTPDCA